MGLGFSDWPMFYAPGNDEELAFELGELPVELADDTGAPTFSELLEFLGEVHLVVLIAAHAWPSNT